MSPTFRGPPRSRRAALADSSARALRRRASDRAPSVCGRSGPVRAALAAGIALSGGCALVPRGTDQERQKLEALSGRYEPPLEQRQLPELPEQPAWQDVLRRTMLANGDLEAAWFDWKAALERVAIASGWPNSNVAFGYAYQFSGEDLSTFDRMTFSAGFDAMENLAFPAKTAQAGEIALDQARAAGERFRASKFALQERVLSAWAEYALAAEKVRIYGRNLGLVDRLLDTARGRVQAGGMQHDLLRAEVEQRRAQDALRVAEADLAARRAMLNGLMARPPQAPLAPPVGLPEPRPVPADDALLLAAADRNPELAALAHEVRGRADALELARLQWIPDINPAAMFTGSIAQAIGAMVILPTTIAEIRGAIDEARSMLRASEGALRQMRHETAARFVATLVALRDSERQAGLFQEQVLPAAERVLANVQASFASGMAPYLDLIDSQRVLLDVRLTIAEAAASREKRLAELEAIAAVDLETLVGPPATVAFVAPVQGESP
jgi:outer membrane protein TolC